MINKSFLLEIPVNPIVLGAIWIVYVELHPGKVSSIGATLGVKTYIIIA